MRTLTVLKVSQAARNQSHIPLERVKSYHDRVFDIHVRVVSMKVAELNACALIPLEEPAGQSFWPQPRDEYDLHFRPAPVDPQGQLPG